MKGRLRLAVAMGTALTFCPWATLAAAAADLYVSSHPADLGGGASVPNPVGGSFTGGSGLTYTNSSSEASGGASASLQFTPATVTGQLTLGSCYLTAYQGTGAGALVVQDPVPQDNVNSGYINFSTYSGTTIATNSCGIGGTPILMNEPLATTVYYSNDHRLGGDTIWGSIQLINENPTIPNVVDGISIMGYFTISSNSNYIAAVLPALTSRLGSGLVLPPPGAPCGSCVINGVAILSGLPSQIVYGVGSPSPTDATSALAAPGTDGCDQAACSHEISFYHGPTVGVNRQCGSTICYTEPNRYLGFHFASDPLINQNNMTQPSCTDQYGNNCCPSGCYPAGGDPAAAATSLGYPEDLGSYVKDFNIAAWLPPQNSPSQSTCGGCQYIAKEEFDFRYNSNDFTEVSENPSAASCANQTSTNFSAAVDFGLDAVPILMPNKPAVALSALVAKQFTKNDQSQCYYPSRNTSAEKEDYWVFHPDGYNENVSGLSHAKGVQISLQQQGNHVGASATATHAWAAIDYVNFYCTDQSQPYLCSNTNEYSYPGDSYVTSNPSGLTKPSAGQAGDATTGDIVFDQYNWLPVDPNNPNGPKQIGPNGYTQDWIVAPPAALKQLCNTGLQQPLISGCSPQTVLAASSDAEFFLGYGGEQRAGTNHTLRVNIVDLSRNLPRDHQVDTADNTVAFGGPGSGLAGISVSNRYWWLVWGDAALTKLVDPSAHEIQVFDRHEEDTGEPNGINQGPASNPYSIPIATFDFGVEPCPSGSCPRDSSVG